MTMTDDELVDILLQWSSAEILAFVRDEARPRDARDALWTAFCETSTRADEHGPVLRVPARLVEKVRANVAVRGYTLRVSASE